MQFVFIDEVNIIKLMTLQNIMSKFDYNRINIK